MEKLRNKQVWTILIVVRKENCKVYKKQEISHKAGVDWLKSGKTSKDYYN